MRNFLRTDEKTLELSIFPLDVYGKGGYITSRNKIGERIMKQYIKDLLTLQAEDIRIRELKTRLMSIPAERAKLVAEFDVVRKGLEKAKQNKLKVEQAVKQQAAATSAAQDRLQALKIKSSSIKKINEYNAILAEIEA